MALKTSRGLLAAAAAALLLAGCEDIPTNSERPTLRAPGGASQDLREGLESDTRTGMRLARERQAGSVATRSIYVVPPHPPAQPRREPTRAERIMLYRFVESMVEAASNHDPALCTDYFAPQHVSRVYGAPSQTAIERCKDEVARSDGSLTFLGIKRLGTQPRNSFTVEFATRGGRKTKTHNMLVVAWGDGHRVLSGSSTVL